jgi:hypothetical protein
MIQTHEIPDGVMLVLEPFKSPNRNSACKVIAEVRSTRPERRDVRFRICDLEDQMTLSDMTLFMNSLRLLTDQVNQQMVKVQERAAKRGRKKR